MAPPNLLSHAAGRPSAGIPKLCEPVQSEKLRASQRVVRLVPPTSRAALEQLHSLLSSHGVDWAKTFGLPYIE